MMTRFLSAAAVAACLAVSDAGLPDAWGQQKHKFTGLHPRIGFQPFSPDGKLLVVQTRHGNAAKLADMRALTIWDVAKEQILTTLVETDEDKHWVRAAFPPDGKTLAADNHDGGMTFWDVATWKEKQKLPPPSVKRISPSRSMFSPDGRFLAQAYQHVVGRRPPKVGNSLRIWDCQRSRERVTIDLDGLLHSLRFSPDGKSLVGALTVELKRRGQDSRVAGEVQSWDMTTFKRKKRLQGFGTWDLKRGRIAQTLGLVWSGPRRRLALSPDAKLLVTTHLDKIVIWDVGTGASTWLGSHPIVVYNVAFSSDGRTLATTADDFGDGIVKLWDLKTGRLLANLKHGQQRTWVPGVAFSPDGNWLATTSHRRGESLYLWKLPVDSRGVPRPVPIGVQLPDRKMGSGFISSDSRPVPPFPVED